MRYAEPPKGLVVDFGWLSAGPSVLGQGGTLVNLFQDQVRQRDARESATWGWNLR